MADYSIQYTFRQGEVMVNVPILEEDPDLMGDEIEIKLNVVYVKAELSASVQAQLNAQAVTAGILGGRTISQTTTAREEAPPAAAASRGSSLSPVCDCGQPRRWKEGVSKAGKPYKGWMCANSVCSPVWQK